MSFGDSSTVPKEGAAEEVPAATNGSVAEIIYSKADPTPCPYCNKLFVTEFATWIHIERGVKCKQAFQQHQRALAAAAHHANSSHNSHHHHNHHHPHHTGSGHLQNVSGNRSQPHQSSLLGTESWPSAVAGRSATNPNPRRSMASVSLVPGPALDSSQGPIRAPIPIDNETIQCPYCNKKVRGMPNHAQLLNMHLTESRHCPRSANYQKPMSNSLYGHSANSSAVLSHPMHGSPSFKQRRDRAGANSSIVSGASPSSPQMGDRGSSSVFSPTSTRGPSFPTGKDSNGESITKPVITYGHKKLVTSSGTIASPSAATILMRGSPTGANSSVSGLARGGSKRNSSLANSTSSPSAVLYLVPQPQSQHAAIAGASSSSTTITAATSSTVTTLTAVTTGREKNDPSTTGSGSSRDARDKTVDTSLSTEGLGSEHQQALLQPQQQATHTHEHLRGSEDSTSNSKFNMPRSSGAAISEESGPKDMSNGFAIVPIVSNNSITTPSPTTVAAVAAGAEKDMPPVVLPPPQAVLTSSSPAPSTSPEAPKPRRMELSVEAISTSGEATSSSTNEQASNGAGAVQLLMPSPSSISVTLQRPSLAEVINVQDFIAKANADQQQQVRQPTTPTTILSSSGSYAPPFPITVHSPNDDMSGTGGKASLLQQGNSQYQYQRSQVLLGTGASTMRSGYGANLAGTIGQLQQGGSAIFLPEDKLHELAQMPSYQFTPVNESMAAAGPNSDHSPPSSFGQYLSHSPPHNQLSHGSRSASPKQQNAAINNNPLSTDGDAPQSPLAPMHRRSNEDGTNEPRHDTQGSPHFAAVPSKRASSGEGSLADGSKTFASEMAFSPLSGMPANNNPDALTITSMHNSNNNPTNAQKGPLSVVSVSSPVQESTAKLTLTHTSSQPFLPVTKFQQKSTSSAAQGGGIGVSASSHMAVINNGLLTPGAEGIGSSSTNTSNAFGVAGHLLASMNDGTSATRSTTSVPATSGTSGTTTTSDGAPGPLSIVSEQTQPLSVAASSAALGHSTSAPGDGASTAEGTSPPAKAMPTFEAGKVIQSLERPETAEDTTVSASPRGGANANSVTAPLVPNTLSDVAGILTATTESLNFGQSQSEPFHPPLLTPGSDMPLFGVKKRPSEEAAAKRREEEEEDYLNEFLFGGEPTSHSKPKTTSPAASPAGGVVGNNSNASNSTSPMASGNNGPISPRHNTIMSGGGGASSVRSHSIMIGHGNQNNSSNSMAGSQSPMNNISAAPPSAAGPFTNSAAINIAAGLQRANTMRNLRSGANKDATTGTSNSLAATATVNSPQIIGNNTDALLSLVGGGGGTTPSYASVAVGGAGYDVGEHSMSISDFQPKAGDTPCPYCKRWFKGQHGLNVHMGKTPCGQQRRQTTMSFGFEGGGFDPSEQSVSMSIADPHAPNVTPCPYCNRNFKGTYGLNIHLAKNATCRRAMLADTDNIYTCDGCQKTFKSKAARQLHWAESPICAPASQKNNSVFGPTVLANSVSQPSYSPAARASGGLEVMPSNFNSSLNRPPALQFAGSSIGGGGSSLGDGSSSTGNKSQQTPTAPTIGGHQAGSFATPPDASSSLSHVHAAATAPLGTSSPTLHAPAPPSPSGSHISTSAIHAATNHAERSPLPNVSAPPSTIGAASTTGSIPAPPPLTTTAPPPIVPPISNFNFRAPLNLDNDDTMSTLSINVNQRAKFKHTNEVRREQADDGVLMVNDYMLLKEIGKGQFGVVWMAYNETSAEVKAVKEIQKKQLRAQFRGNKNKENRDLTRRDSMTSSAHRGAATETDAATNAAQQIDLELVKEIAVMKKLHHKNIVSLEEVIDDPHDDKMFLVMPLIEGGSLVEDRHYTLNTSPLLPIGTVRDYVRQITAALTYLHSRNVVHCDIKPANILKGTDDTVYLSDFGVSVIFNANDDEEEDSADAAAKQTQQLGKTMMRSTNGTPAFLAPETLTGEYFDGKGADIWATGVTLYFLVFGRMPFWSNNSPGLFEKIKANKPDYEFNENDRPFYIQPDDRSREEKQEDAYIRAQAIDLIRGMLISDPNQRPDIKICRRHPFLSRKAQKAAKEKEAAAAQQQQMQQQQSSLISPASVTDFASPLPLSGEASPTTVIHPITSGDANDQSFQSATALAGPLAATSPITPILAPSHATTNNSSSSPHIATQHNGNNSMMGAPTSDDLSTANNQVNLTPNGSAAQPVMYGQPANVPIITPLEDGSGLGGSIFDSRVGQSAPNLAIYAAMAQGGAIDDNSLRGPMVVNASGSGAPVILSNLGAASPTGSASMNMTTTTATLFSTMNNFALTNTLGGTMTMGLMASGGSTSPSSPQHIIQATSLSYSGYQQPTSGDGTASQRQVLGGRQDTGYSPANSPQQSLQQVPSMALAAVALTSSSTLSNGPGGSIGHPNRSADSTSPTASVGVVAPSAATDIATTATLPTIPVMQSIGSGAGGTATGGNGFQSISSYEAATVLFGGGGAKVQLSHPSMNLGPQQMPQFQQHQQQHHHHSDAFPNATSAGGAPGLLTATVLSTTTEASSTSQSPNNTTRNYRHSPLIILQTPSANGSTTGIGAGGSIGLGGSSTTGPTVLGANNSATSPFIAIPPVYSTAHPSMGTQQQQQLSASGKEDDGLAQVCPHCGEFFHGRKALNLHLPKCASNINLANGLGSNTVSASNYSSSSPVLMGQNGGGAASSSPSQYSHSPNLSAGNMGGAVVGEVGSASYSAGPSATSASASQHSEGAGRTQSVLSGQVQQDQPIPITSNTIQVGSLSGSGSVGKMNALNPMHVPSVAHALTGSRHGHVGIAAATGLLSSSRDSAFGAHFSGGISQQSAGGSTASRGARRTVESETDTSSSDDNSKGNGSSRSSSSGSSASSANAEDRRQERKKRRHDRKGAFKDDLTKEDLTSSIASTVVRKSMALSNSSAASRLLNSRSGRGGNVVTASGGGSRGGMARGRGGPQQGRIIAKPAKRGTDAAAGATSSAVTASGPTSPHRLVRGRGGRVGATLEVASPFDNLNFESEEVPTNTTNTTPARPHTVPNVTSAGGSGMSAIRSLATEHHSADNSADNSQPQPTVTPTPAERNIASAPPVGQSAFPSRSPNHNHYQLQYQQQLPTYQFPSRDSIVSVDTMPGATSFSSSIAGAATVGPSSASRLQTLSNGANSSGSPLTPFPQGIGAQQRIGAQPSDHTEADFFAMHGIGM